MFAEEQLNKLQNQFNKDTAALYFVGRYYFSVNTHKFRSNFGLAPGAEITLAAQQTIQAQNFLSLFHEYIHYIHEISTVVGNVGLSLDLILKSLFSNYFSTDLSSSTHLGIDLKNRDLMDIFSKIYTTKEVMNGGGPIEGKLLKVNSFSHILQDIYVLNGIELQTFKIDIPMVSISTFYDNKFMDIEVLFGKFYIYEGLAYELEKEIEKQVLQLIEIKDDQKGSEYTMLRSLAKFIFPEIDKESFLVAASLSLSYINSGYMFVSLIERIKKESQMGIKIKDVLLNLKRDVSKLLGSKIIDFNEAQEEITAIFKKRKQLNISFTTITDEAKAGYLSRCESPTFEVDLILRGEFLKLYDLIPICDYMYCFKAPDEYMRDFLGTASYTYAQSQALEVLIAYDHYQKSHWLQSTIAVEKTAKSKCPFFSTCNLGYRKTHEQICAERPWRIFEVSFSGNKQYCWYGQAVGEFKGHNEL